LVVFSLQNDRPIAKPDSTTSCPYLYWGIGAEYILSDYDSSLPISPETCGNASVASIVVLSINFNYHSIAELVKTYLLPKETTRSLEDVNNVYYS
jgi:hypothetical protein